MVLIKLRTIKATRWLISAEKKKTKLFLQMYVMLNLQCSWQKTFAARKLRIKICLYLVLNYSPLVTLVTPILAIHYSRSKVLTVVNFSTKNKFIYPCSFHLYELYWFYLRITYRWFYAVGRLTPDAAFPSDFSQKC